MSYNYLRSLFLVAIVGVLSLPFALHADWINLKSGGRVQGKIVRHDSREISIRTEEGGMLTFQMRQVADYHRSGVKHVDRSSKRTGGKSRGRAGESTGGVVYEDGDSAPKSPEQNFKVGATTLPPTFQAAKTLPPVAHGEKNLGAFQEPRTGSHFAAITATIPASSPNFAAYTRVLRRQFLAQEQFRILRWQQRTVDDRPALYAEIETKDKESPKILILQWISLSPETVCRLSLTVPKTHYKLRTEAYSSIVLDFHLNDEAPAEAGEAPKTADEERGN